MKPKKVLHLITWLNRGGIELWLLDMLRAVPRTEWEMDVCCIGKNLGTLAAEARQLGASVLHCPRWPMILSFARRLQCILREGQYDILHTHVAVNSGPAVKAAQKQGVPVVATFHNTVFAPSSRWVRLPLVRGLRALYTDRSVGYAVDHSDVVTGVSQGVLDSVCAKRVPPPESARVLYLGAATPAPLSLEQKREFRDSLSVCGDDPLILHVGRFHKQKNHLGLLDVFERLLQSVPAAHLVLVGQGGLRVSVEKSVHQRGLASRVHFLGLRDDVSTIMQAADILLMPSLHEGLPIVVMEAGAAGLPLVASRIPGIVEGVEDGVTGFLHDVQDVSGMAQSVANILLDADCRRRLAAAGKERHARLFSRETSADRLTTLYEGLCNSEVSGNGLATGRQPVGSRLA